MPTLTPAYGRDYPSKAAAVADFTEGKDFVLNDASSPHDGRYINVQGARAAGWATVNLRYKRLTRVAVVKVPRGGK